MTCPTCRRPEREDEIHSWSPPGVHDAFGQPIAPACYTDEGDAIEPDEESCACLFPEVNCPVHGDPALGELSAVSPDPWTDPDAAARAVPPPF